jgi:hypothetical protein
MIREAMNDLYSGDRVGYRQIKDWITNKYGDVNENTMNAQIIVCTVNHPSRVHYPENKKPRIANGKYDFLYTVGNGQVVKYDPATHGIWQLKENEFGKLSVAPLIEEEVDEDDVGNEYTFALERHLQDFIVKNISTLKFNSRNLSLYVDENGRDGKEYPTEVGKIDILANDDSGNLVVFELKVEKGVDAALGQILRYIGWLKRKVAGDKKVTGIIVAANIDDKLRFAINAVDNVELFEYQLEFNISPIKEM